MTIQAAIIIPARYGSTRFEGKPLALIAGRPMLEHAYVRAKMAAAMILDKYNADGGDKDASGTIGNDTNDNDAALDITISVATDDARIADFCLGKNIPFVITSPTCKTGSDRVLEAVKSLNTQRETLGHDSISIVLNLQGDNPFAAEEGLIKVLEDLIENPDHMVATPVAALDWAALDVLREHKKTVPFSGTTTVFNADHKCLWFSKNILPAIRKEDQLRKASSLSPVHQHIGLYGYRMEALEIFVTLPEGHYEALEGLEQLRLLENGIDIYGCPVSPENVPPVSGIDTMEDLMKAEALIKSGVIILPEFDD